MIDKICEIVEQYFEFDNGELQSSRQKRYLVEARYLAMYFSTVFTSVPDEIIGRKIGNKDRTTVIYAIKQVRTLKKTDKNFLVKFDDLLIKIADYKKSML